MKYILELMERDGTYIEYLCTNSSERIYSPTTITMNAFKAERFSEDELNNIGWYQEEALREFGTMIKIVRIL